MQAIEFDAGSGNYLLRDITELTIPPAIPLYPVAIGWQLLALLLGVFVIFKLWRFALKWRKDGYRRDASALLIQLPSSPDALAQQLLFILKLTALQAYPRTKVARLSGDELLTFLETESPGSGFATSRGKLLVDLAHQSKGSTTSDATELAAITDMTKQWITNHKGVN